MKLIVCLFFFFFLTAPVSAEDINYCNDKKSWDEWNEFVRKYPQSNDIQILHAVRIGFCRKIEKGSISIETARYVFNHMHEVAIKKADKKKRQYLENLRL